MTEEGGDVVVYLDTKTGILENREYVEEVCDTFGWQLWTLRTHEDFESWVQEHGFPGAGHHFMAYNKLKDRQLQKLATIAEQPLNLYAGYRRLESERRMKTVEPKQEYDRWTVYAPIHDFSKQDCVDYIEEHAIPRNDLWDTLGRSGDCFCGCYGTREELLDLRAAECEQHAEWIEELEETVDRDDERCKWAWSSMSDVKKRAERVDDNQMNLCSDCGFK
jgi:3'-phosphoadenosine 5'-phosphosulfate sulfotransferase (PAPS reductase)/FAD synthetase